MVADFNQEITSRMQSIAQEKAKLLKINVKHIAHAPGSFDTPILVDALLQRPDIDGVVTIGAIIKGQTKHDEIISHATAQKLTEISIKHKKPVSLGISGPGMQSRQAYARIRPVAEHAVEAILQISEELDKIVIISK